MAHKYINCSEFNVGDLGDPDEHVCVLAILAILAIPTSASFDAKNYFLFVEVTFLFRYYFFVSMLLFCLDVIDVIDHGIDAIRMTSVPQTLEEEISANFLMVYVTILCYNVYRILGLERL